VLVLVRHEEAVQALGGHGLADEREVLFAEGGVGDLIEGLMHAALLVPQARGAKPDRQPETRRLGRTQRALAMTAAAMPMEPMLSRLLENNRAW
jgi:hypothetical protein